MKDIVSLSALCFLGAIANSLMIQKNKRNIWLRAQPVLKKSLVFMSKITISIFGLSAVLKTGWYQWVNNGLESDCRTSHLLFLMMKFYDSYQKWCSVFFYIQRLKEIIKELKEKNSSLLKKEILLKYGIHSSQEFDVKKVFLIRDYNPYAIKETLEIKDFFRINSIEVFKM